MSDYSRQTADALLAKQSRRIERLEAALAEEHEAFMAAVESGYAEKERAEKAEAALAGAREYGERAYELAHQTDPWFPSPPWLAPPAEEAQDE